MLTKITITIPLPFLDLSLPSVYPSFQFPPTSSPFFLPRLPPTSTSPILPFPQPTPSSYPSFYFPYPLLSPPTTPPTSPLPPSPLPSSLLLPLPPPPPTFPSSSLPSFVAPPASLRHNMREKRNMHYQDAKLALHLALPRGDYERLRA